MPSQLKSFIMMLLATLSFSMLAPVSALSIRVDPVLLLSAGSFIALVAHIPFLKNMKCQFTSCPHKLYLLMILGGSVGAWAYVLFTNVLRQSENALIPVLIFELYPILTVFLAGLFLAKQKIRLGQYLWIVVCLFGVCLLVLDGNDFSFAGLKESMAENAGLYIQMLLAVLLYSFGFITFLYVSRSIGGNASDGVFISFLNRIVHFMITLPFANWSQLWGFVEHDDIQSLSFILVYGLFALTISSILYYAAVNINKSNLLHMMMYLGPVFSALWLALLGLGSFTLATVLGGGLIILAVLKITLPEKVAMRRRKAPPPAP